MVNKITKNCPECDCKECDVLGIMDTADKDGKSVRVVIYRCLSAGRCHSHTTPLDDNEDYKQFFHESAYSQD